MLSRRLLSFAALVVLVVSATTFVAAQESAEQTLRDAREAQEQNRRDQAELAKDIDVLEATDVELLAALEALNAQILAQEQLVASARNEFDQARAEEARLRLEIEATNEHAEELRELALQRMVAAYVAPRDQAMGSDDPTADARRSALFRQVDLDSRDLIDELRTVEDDLGVLERDADLAAIDAAGRESELNAALDLLADDVAAQQRLRNELSDEIAALEQEFADMAATEAMLAGIIRDQRREIARQEALARAATSTTTTTAAPTTTSTTAPDPDDPNTNSGDPATDDQAADDTATDTDTGDATDSGTTTTTAAPINASLDLIWPTTGAVTSGFGNRIHPITGGSRWHAGIDIGSRSGTAIWAAQSGTVIFSGWMSGYGETVMIDHGSFVTLYAHQSQRQVREGARISQGQQLGLVGSTGNSTGPHLHFEVRISGSAVNPMPYLS